MIIGSTSVGRAPALQTGFLSWMLPPTRQIRKGGSHHLSWDIHIHLSTNILRNRHLIKRVRQRLQPLWHTLSRQRFAMSYSNRDRFQSR